MREAFGKRMFGNTYTGEVFITNGDDKLFSVIEPKPNFDPVIAISVDIVYDGDKPQREDSKFIVITAEATSIIDLSGWIEKRFINEQNVDVLVDRLNRRLILGNTGFRQEGNGNTVIGDYSKSIKLPLEEKLQHDAGLSKGMARAILNADNHDDEQDKAFLWKEFNIHLPEDDAIVFVVHVRSKDQFYLACGITSNDNPVHGLKLPDMPIAVQHEGAGLIKVFFDNGGSRDYYVSGGYILGKTV